MKVRKRSTCWLAFILLCCCSAAMGQELPYYEVEYGLKETPEDYSTGGLENRFLTLENNYSRNDIPISNYLVADKDTKGYSDSLSGAGIPIGFDFPFAGDTFDVFGVSAKGFIVLGKKKEGLKIYADTLRYEANDTVFTKRNPFLISTLMFGRNLGKVYSAYVSYSKHGFPGKRSCVISFSYYYFVPVAGSISLFYSFSAILLHEDGRIDISFLSFFNENEHPSVSSLGFFLQRYGEGKEARFWADTLNGNTSYANLQEYYGTEERFGVFTNDFYPKEEDKTYTLTFIPKSSPLAPVEPFIWDLQGRQGKLTGYYDKDHSLLEKDTVSTTTTLWWYAPQYEPIRYDAYLGTDTLSMTLVSADVNGDSVNPRNGFQKVPLARLELDSLAPSTHYYLKIVSKSATDSLVSYTSFYTDSIEEAYNYCTYIQGDFWDCVMNKISFNQMQFSNPSPNFFMYNRLVPDTGSWTTTLKAGKAYTFSVEAACNAAYQDIKAYIDFNHDGIFGDEEGFYAPKVPGENRYKDISILVPSSAFLGETRMRVATGTPGFEYNIQPCGPSYIDFTVTIVQPDSCKSLSYTINELPACFRQSNGSLHVVPNGGIVPYKIQWNTGNPADTLASLSGLAVNTMHRARITDSRGCNLRTTMAVVTQSSPVQIDTSIMSQQKLVFKGGNAPYEVEITGNALPASVIYTGITDTLDISSLENASYSITATEASGCTYDLASISILPTRIAQKQELKQVMLYPNPARNLTRVQNFSGFTAQIYDISGALLRQTEDSGTGQIQLDGLEPGLYLIQIYKDTEIYRQKLLIK